MSQMRREGGPDATLVISESEGSIDDWSLVSQIQLKCDHGHIKICKLESNYSMSVHWRWNSWQCSWLVVDKICSWFILLFIKANSENHYDAPGKQWTRKWITFWRSFFSFLLPLAIIAWAGVQLNKLPKMPRLGQELRQEVLSSNTS